ncbi:MAG: 30S ribosomal protein S1, partial [Gillisia sp.]
MAEETKNQEVQDSENPEVQTKAAPSPQQENPEKFLADFNWHNYEEGIDPVDDQKLVEFEKLVAENFVDTLDDEVTTGRVINITDRDAIID